jgi:hypothetical protein
MAEWPRCNFRFFTQDSPGPSGRRWRVCRRAWGHWINGSAHMGPVADALDSGTGGETTEENDG